MPAVMFPEFHRESCPFCVVVCVMPSSLVQWDVSAMAPVAVVRSNPAETPTIAIERRTRVPLRSWGRSTAPGPGGMVR